MSRVSFEGEIPDWVLSNEDSLEEWLQSSMTTHSYSIRRVVYTFCTDEIIQGLNKSLLGHDYPTDIITLNHSRGASLRVEMFLGHQVILRNAKDLGLPFEEELCRVLIHGLLHCIGFDDISGEERERMRAEEEKFLISRPK